MWYRACGTVHVVPYPPRLRQGDTPTFKQHSLSSTTEISGFCGVYRGFCGVCMGPGPLAALTRRCGAGRVRRSGRWRNQWMS